MNRPFGVTVSAVVAFIGSILALFFAVMFVVVAATQPAPPGMPGFHAFAYAMALVVAVLGGLGIATAVGAWKLRPWARTSMLVFGGITAAFTLAGGAAIAIMPLPATPDVSVAADRLRQMLLVFYAIPFLIGVWWLIQFNRKGTKDAFATGTTDGEMSRRPLMITIIGWFNIVGGVVLLGAALSGGSAFAAGFVLDGWGAPLFYVFLGAVNTFLGWRLLQLDERARVLTIWWFTITIAHSAFIAFTPRARATLREIEVTMRPEGTQPQPMNSETFILVMLTFGIVLLAGAIWPLIAAKSAFETREDESRAG